MKRNLLFITVFLFVSFLCIGCGLDSFYYLDPPISGSHTPRYSDNDTMLYYFSFLTSETEANGSFGESDFTFLGTEVYYKIYNNASNLAGVNSAIDSMNTTSDVSSAATSLINSYGYKPLSFAGGPYRSPLVMATGSNVYVYIRPASDPTFSPDFAPAICFSTKSISSVGNSEVSYITERLVPRRAINSKYGFHFNSDDSNNPVPVSQDSDVSYGSFTESRVWYVDMYAVSLGRDSSYSPSYSKVLHLGTVPVREEWFD